MKKVLLIVFLCSLVSGTAFASMKPINWVVVTVFLDAFDRGEMRDIINPHGYSFSSKELCTEFLLNLVKHDSTATLSYDPFGMPMVHMPDNLNSLYMCIAILKLPENDSN